MSRRSIKSEAEAVMRELPSVLGAYVSEDSDGNPREVHLLVRAGPDLAAFARDLKALLEERLGIPIDQRVISIAQVAPEPGEGPADGDSGAADGGSAGRGSEPRAIFAGIESVVSAGQVTVVVRLEWRGSTVQGAAEAGDTTHGRARAAATATLRAASAAAAEGDLGLELDFASVVQALEGDYVLASVIGLSSRSGRRPLTLVGAHPVDQDVESAAIFATLKAINRVLALALHPH